MDVARQLVEQQDERQTPLGRGLQRVQFASSRSPAEIRVLGRAFGVECRIGTKPPELVLIAAVGGRRSKPEFQELALPIL